MIKGASYKSSALRCTCIAHSEPRVACIVYECRQDAGGDSQDVQHQERLHAGTAAGSAVSGGMPALTPRTRLHIQQEEEEEVKRENQWAFE